jgi:hypothetical protein
MMEMPNVPSTVEKFKSYVINSFGIKTEAGALELWHTWNQYKQDAKAPAPPPTDPKECNKCGKRFMTMAIAEIHREKCSAGQLNSAHHMPLRTVKGPGLIILSKDREEMKDIYSTLIRDPARVPQEYGKFKAHVKATLKTEVLSIIHSFIHSSSSSSFHS